MRGETPIHPVSRRPSRSKDTETAPSSGPPAHLLPRGEKDQGCAPRIPTPSEPLADTTFDALVDATAELLDHLNVGPRFLHVHDWGAPVALGLALRAPDQVLGLIIQNGNAHDSGMDPELWKDARAYWADPSPKNEEQATAHLNAEKFVRAQYVDGLPDDIAARIEGEPWKQDWAVLQQPGRLAAQKALILDNGRTKSPASATTPATSNSASRRP